MYSFLLVDWIKEFENFFDILILNIPMYTLLIFCCSMRYVHYRVHWENFYHLNYKHNWLLAFLIFFFLAFLCVFNVCVCEWVCGLHTGVYVGKCMEARQVGSLLNLELSFCGWLGSHQAPVILFVSVDLHVGVMGMYGVLLCVFWDPNFWTMFIWQHC